MAVKGTIGIIKGSERMITETKLTVRYAETDQMGIVHYSNYAVWFEAGRMELLELLGTSNEQIEENGILIPLYELKCQFKSPAKFGEEVIVRSRIKAVSRARLSFSYEVLRSSNDEVIALGETDHAWTDRTLKPVNVEKRIPEIYKKMFYQNKLNQEKGI